ncbi:MAG: UMP kinase [Gammaproteobacteria bacterium]|nr:UMP kinase [Gammaproteobacteria bacterium]
MAKAYQRVLLKVSGEFFDSHGVHLDPERFKKLATMIAAMLHRNVQVAVVLGAGNICRGNQLASLGVDQVVADHMGMLATIINALALKDTLLQYQLPAEVCSALSVPSVANQYVRDDALSLLMNDFVVICAGGTGNPLVTTDSAAVLRAIELGADVVLKATKVDGVYSDDPKKNPNAVRFSHLSYEDVIKNSFEVMDLGAFCLCRDYQMPVRIFNMDVPDIIERILDGADEGTLIS